MKVVRKLNDFILGYLDVPVAKHASQLTFLNCALATCFAAGIHSNLQLTRGRLKNAFLK